MSRPRAATTGLSGRFPRVSGDEPDIFARFLQLEAFSPRERG